MAKSQPRNVLNLSAAYDVGRWSFFARTVRYGEVEAVQLTSATPAQIAALAPQRDTYLRPTVPASANSQIVQRFDANWITDLELTFRWSKQLSASLGANNAFDFRPDSTLPTTIAGTTVFAGNDNQGSLPYLQNPSPFGFNGVFYYGRVSWKF